MSKKQEIAALMAADGDYEQKILLLKKAVVAVTRQKQEAERRCEEVQSTLRETEAALATARAGSDALRRQLASIQGSEGQAESRKSASFRHHTLLQGLSSLVTGSEVAHAGGRTAGPRPTRRGSPRGASKPMSTISLSAEDVERLVAENEMLHKQVFELTTERADLKQIYEVDAECWRKEQTEAQNEVRELQMRLESATQAFDALHQRSMRDAALAAFCRHFVLLTVGASTDSSRLGQGRLPSLMLVAHSVDEEHGGSLDDVRGELVDAPLREFFTMLRSLLASVSALLTACLQARPCAGKTTTGDLRAFEDRLIALREAHEQHRTSLLASMRDLEGILRGAPDTHLVSQSAPDSSLASLTSIHGSVGASPTGQVRIVQRVMVQDALGWATLLREHALLLVDAVMACVPETHICYATSLTADAARSKDKKEIVSRRTFTNIVVHEVHAALCVIEGVLEAMQTLLERTMDVAMSEPGGLAAGPATLAMSLAGEKMSAIEWLIALQRFLWEGCQALPALPLAVRRLSHYLSCLSDACRPEPLQGALRQSAAALLELAASHADVATSTTASDHGATSPSPGTATEGQTSEQTIAIDDGDELMGMLALCDRAAMGCQYRMTDALLALAAREAALCAAEEALQRTRGAFEVATSEATQTRLALEDQIRVLSQQLTASV